MPKNILSRPIDNDPGPENDAVDKARRAALFFLTPDDIQRIEPLGDGNINDTYLVTRPSGDPVVLQRLNPEVFADPLVIMRNMRLVTAHLEKMAAALPPQDRFQPLRLLAGDTDTRTDADGGVWRLVNLIEGRSRDRVTTNGQARALGRAMGRFHTMLSTLNPESLTDPLPGFHDTPAHLHQYDRISTDRPEPEDPFCRDFIDRYRPLAGLLTDRKENLSHGIIHGDPKVANFIFSRDRQEVISLIDLDTVQAGPLLLDLGDALRSCCNPAGENPARPEDTAFAHHLFQHWLGGYYEVASFLLTEADETRIVDAIKLISFELGLRFYTDYLAGNLYFKVSSATRNLERARTQFHLVRSIEEQDDQLNAIVRTLARAKQQDD